jgi:sulfur-oxidizing protein SoxX
MRWRGTVVIGVAAGIAGAALLPEALAEGDAIARYEIVGDAIPRPLGGHLGDPDRGRRIVLDRETGNCLICHRLPEPGERFQGDLAPSLEGVGKRLGVGQLRLRLVDQSRINPATLMPPYHRVDGLSRVAERYRGRPVLTAAEIEDVVAFLATLRD